ncbi:glycosyl hydrolase [Armatimonadota bacterium]|nr:glycosyl hydrolase [Armatimonadota bacterium]
MLYYQIGITLSLVAFVGLVLRNLRVYCKPSSQMPQESPFISICIPARNEEANIKQCVQSILAQVYTNFELLVMDDCSEDATADIVRALAARDGRIRLLKGRPIELGWAGKCHACSQLAGVAQGEYLLFMDADTRAEPALVGSAMALIEQTKADMVSAFPYQVTGTFWERVVLPMLQFLITTLLPIHLVWESPSPAFCAACGQFELFRKESYERIGGHAGVRASFHDGLLLARKVKASGGTLRLFDATELLRCRMYEGGRAVWNGFTRNAYEGLGSFGVLLGMTWALGSLFLAPYIFFMLGLWTHSGWTALCVLQILLMLAIRVIQARRFGHTATIPLLPLAIAALIVIQWGSLFRKGQLQSWKGRSYRPL